VAKQALSRQARLAAFLLHANPAALRPSANGCGFFADPSVEPLIAGTQTKHRR